MKRMIAIALAVLMVAALLVGCGGPEGKYVVKSIDGQSVEDAIKTTAESMNTTVDEWLKQIGVDSASEIVTIELKSDGTAVMDVKMFSMSMEGTWEKDGEKISITMKDTSGESSTSKFTLNGNELSNDDGEPKYVFVKK